MKKLLLGVTLLTSFSSLAESNRQFSEEYYRAFEENTRYSKIKESEKRILNTISSGTTIKVSRDLEIPKGKKAISFSENNLSCTLSIEDEGQRIYKRGEELQVVETVQYESLFTFLYTSEYMYLDKDITKIWLDKEQTSSITCIKNNDDKRLNSNNVVKTEGHLSKDEISMALMGSLEIN